MNIRERSETREKEYLSPFAVLSSMSRGRQRYMTPCDVRTEFQRDRDRILHSKSFRRLKYKTQVFISPEGDHYRTRLTHTLEVAQIARTIARALSLNEDLTEAIALGHDLGHTPFGHAGEAAINELLPGGFRHNEQSLRVVDVLEGSGGLNLTFEVRDGILKHTGPDDPVSLEGMIVKISDRIAYINHDIDDALRAGIIRLEELPAHCVKLLGREHSTRINTMVTDLIQYSTDKPTVALSPEILEVTTELRTFLFDYVYLGQLAKQEEYKVRHVIQTMFHLLMDNPALIPKEQHGGTDDGDQTRRTVDFLAGMTDRYAIRFYYDHFIPIPWSEI